jgi:hypothetical protein
LELQPTDAKNYAELESQVIECMHRGITGETRIASALGVPRSSVRRIIANIGKRAVMGTMQPQPASATKPVTTATVPETVLASRIEVGAGIAPVAPQVRSYQYGSEKRPLSEQELVEAVKGFVRKGESRVAPIARALNVSERIVRRAFKQLAVDALSKQEELELALREKGEDQGQAAGTLGAPSGTPKAYIDASAAQQKQVGTASHTAAKTGEIAQVPASGGTLQDTAEAHAGAPGAPARVPLLPGTNIPRHTIEVEATPLAMKVNLDASIFIMYDYVKAAGYDGSLGEFLRETVTSYFESRGFKLAIVRTFPQPIWPQGYPQGYPPGYPVPVYPAPLPWQLVQQQDQEQQSRATEENA